MLYPYGDFSIICFHPDTLKVFKIQGHNIVLEVGSLIVGPCVHHERSKYIVSFLALAFVVQLFLNKCEVCQLSELN